MATLKLYDYPVSGNCYKIRMLLSMLGREYDRVNVDIRAGESMTPEFLRMSPRGQIPVLIDGEDVVWDSMAILVYLARRYGGEAWLPAGPLAESRVMQWLAVAENELIYGLARARAINLLQRPFDKAQCLRDAELGLKALEQQLSQNDWLAADHATIADIACYPYVSLAHEGDISLEPYPSVRTWLKRFDALPGWIALEA
jgi:glutathione S-transferase